jgi:hypothetical protein
MAIRYLSGINVDSNTLFVDASNNRVGIGTTSPGSKLEIDQSANTYTSGFSLRNANNVIYGLYVNGSNDLSFQYQGSDKVTFQSGGNVGIGTTSPVSKLNINNGDAWINVTDTLRGLQFGYAGPSHGSYRAAVMGGAESHGGTDSGMLTFHTQNGYVVSAVPPERMRITSAGNVGIGDTDTYGVRMHIAGVGAATSTGTGSSNIVMLLRDTTAGAQNVGAGIAFAGNDGANTGVTFATINGRKETGTSGDYASYLSFQTRLNGNNLTERMRITSAGNVGIGTTAPVSKFHVDGNASIGTFTDPPTGNHSQLEVRGPAGAGGFTVIKSFNAMKLGQNSGVEYGGQAQFWLGRYEESGSNARTALTISLGHGTIDPSSNADVDVMTLLSNGNVGIGTSPSWKLDVAGYIRANDRFYATNGTNTLEIGSTYIQSYLNSGAAEAPLNFYTGTTEKMRIATGGNVLIGTDTDAGYKLDVSGTGRFTGDLTVGVTSGVNLILEKPTGAYLSFQNGATIRGSINGNNGTDGINLNYGASHTTALAIASTGAATFSSSVEATSFIKTSGTSSQYLMADGSVSTLTNPVTGTGTTNYVTKWTSGSAIGDSGIFDTSGNIVINGTTAINVSSNRGNLTINGTSAILNFGISNVESGYIFPERMRITSGGNVVIGNTTAYGGLTVSDFSANDGNDSISLFYRGTAGNHESLIKFYDFRGQLNASLGNSLVNDGVGTQEARLVFSTSTGGSVTEKMRITGGGNVLINTTTDNGDKLQVSGDATIGAGSGLSRLTIGSGAGYTALILKNNSAYYNFLLGSQYNVSNAFEITPSTTVGGSTFSTPVVTVLASGNVGIGTTDGKHWYRHRNK